MRKKSTPSSLAAAHGQRPHRALVAVVACTTAALLLGAAACDEKSARDSAIPPDLVGPIALSPPTTAVDEPIVNFVAGIPSPVASGSAAVASAAPSAVAVSKPAHIPSVLPPRIGGVAPVQKKSPVEVW